MKSQEKSPLWLWLGERKSSSYEILQNILYNKSLLYRGGDSTRNLLHLRKEHFSQDEVPWSSWWELRGRRTTGVPCLTVLCFIVLQRCCYFFSPFKFKARPSTSKKDSNSLYWDTRWSGTKATLSPRHTCACESRGPENAFDGLLWETAESTAGQEMGKMCLKHLVVPESKKILNKYHHRHHTHTHIITHNVNGTQKATVRAPSGQRWKH